ncbi:DUF6009 family protein, partial [Streptomyces sp. NPDC031705]
MVPKNRIGSGCGPGTLCDSAEADPDSGLQKRRVFYLLPHDR